MINFLRNVFGGAKTKEERGFDLGLGVLREVNTLRQEIWCPDPDQQPGTLFRATELGGEVGEALNVVKKLERERNGWVGSRATKEDLASELADIIICVDLLAMAEGIDLVPAVIAKFNATSEKVGIDVFLTTKDEVDG